MEIKKLLADPTNYRRGNIENKKYLVIHWVGAASTAKNNAQYFANNKRLLASAHFFVDDTEIWASVPMEDTAFSVGDGQGKKGITNENSINIEMCCKVATIDELSYAGYTITEKTKNQAALLAACILLKYPNLILARHYDASGKWCPGLYVEYPLYWQKFKDKVYYYKELVGGDFMWEQELMVDAIKTLQDNGVQVSDEWKEKDAEAKVPMWLFWEMLQRLVSRETK